MAGANLASSFAKHPFSATKHDEEQFRSTRDADAYRPQDSSFNDAFLTFFGFQELLPRCLQLIIETGSFVLLAALDDLALQFFALVLELCFVDLELCNFLPQLRHLATAGFVLAVERLRRV